VPVGEGAVSFYLGAGIDDRNRAERKLTTFFEKKPSFAVTNLASSALLSIANMTSEAERPLQVLLAEGQEPAFVELYDRFADSLYAVALTVTGSTADAEDAVHDTFLAVWQSHRAMAGVAKLETYLFTSLRRAAVRVVQKRRRSRHVAIAQAGTGSIDRCSLGTSVELDRALQNLPVAQREVIALKIDGGLTFADIAAVLGISANTAASRYRLGLEKMREVLKHDA
jgi:RNA polymerase sigma-70 factor, ECF subfamily